MKDVLRESVTAALAGKEDALSLPALEKQIRDVQAQLADLLQNAFNAGSQSTDFDEEIGRLNRMIADLLDKKAALKEKESENTEFDQRMAEINGALMQESGAITEYEDMRVRQLVSNIKVVDKEHLLVRFRDGSEIERRIDTKKGVCEV